MSDREDIAGSSVGGARYDSVVKELYERHRSVRDAGFGGGAYKPGLEAMEAYAAFLGHPERQFRSIHVAGTNGKGSVCSMLAAALAARGLRVGLYTSPHLIDFRERIKVVSLAGGAVAGELDAIANAAKITGLRGRWEILLDEPLTICDIGHNPPALALSFERLALLRSETDTARFASVSRSSAAPSFSMIPKDAVVDFLAGYDCDGLTFFEITTGMAFWWFAQQKVDVAVIETGLGGRLDSTNIITPEVSVVTSIGLDHCDLLGSTRAEIAAEKAGIFKPGVPAVVWGRDPETQPVFERIASSLGAPLYFAEDLALPVLPPLDLPGPCQDTNLRTTLTALAKLSKDRFLQPSDSQPHIDSPMRNFAHRSFDKSLGDSELRKTPLPLVVVYGAMRDKDVDAIADLLPEDAEYFLVQPATLRAMPLAELALKLKHFDTIHAGTVAQGVSQAMARARELPGAILYICGSTFVVSEAITYLESL